jgi:hypothetical protein
LSISLNLPYWSWSGIPVTERPIALPPVTTGARYANAAIPERREV